MNTNLKDRLGAFTIFGYTKKPENLLKRRLSERLGIVPRTVDFGNAGRFFFHTSYGDIAEMELVIVLKLGFVRSPTKSPLSAQQLLDGKIATPQRIDHDAIRGNALIACFSKTEAEFVAFKNLISLPQLYYWVSGDELIGSDNLRCLVAVLDRVELNEDILPFHFLFSHAPGTLTHFQNVQRLLPGQLLKWHEGNLNIRRVQDLRFPHTDLAVERVDPHSVTVLYQELKDVVGTYISEIENSGHGLGNLLSGGVDSSILQLIINERLSPTPARSFSFALTRAPSFEFEVEYARQASEILKAEHTFVELTPEDYPGLLVKATEILGQPVFSHEAPCKLALEEFLMEHVKDLHFFFTAQGADALFGLGVAKKLKVFDLFRRVPSSRLALAGAGRLLKPFTGKSQTLLKGAEILSHPNDPHLFIAPTNMIGVYSNLDTARRFFGDATLRQVFEYKRSLEVQYLNSANYIEKVQVIDLLVDACEVQAQCGQLALANNHGQIYPFMDSDIIRMSFAFRPEIRYTRGLRTKPLLKDILEQRGLSTIARRPKGSTVFEDDLYAWMHSGPLHEMVRDIDLPGFLSKADFEQLIEKPAPFLWNLLTFDIFQKRILRRDGR